MLATIKRLYSKNKDVTVAVNAVKKGWITKEQYKEITGEAYTD